MNKDGEITIRRATVHDLEAVTTLFEMYREFYNQPPDRDGALHFLEERMNREDAVLFVATKGKILIAFSQLYPTCSSLSMKRVWILNDMFVLPAHRKQGVGANLLRAVLDYAKQTDAKAVVLETAPDNTSAQKLYRRFGFIQDEEFLHFSARVDT